MSGVSHKFKSVLAMPTEDLKGIRKPLLSLFQYELGSCLRLMPPRTDMILPSSLSRAPVPQPAPFPFVFFQLPAWLPAPPLPFSTSALDFSHFGLQLPCVRRLPVGLF